MTVIEKIDRYINEGITSNIWKKIKGKFSMNTLTDSEFILLTLQAHKIYGMNSILQFEKELNRLYKKGIKLSDVQIKTLKSIYEPKKRDVESHIDKRRKSAGLR